MLNPYGVVYLPENRCKRGHTGRGALYVRGDKPQGSTVPHQNLRFDGCRLVGTSSPHHIGI
ncbi:MAG: hypothetical protein QNJ51_19565 [Calothrix sp. MO_167.B12]|nr:hypothetical protein [Calothrix sp. MO_167.B12]